MSRAALALREPLSFEHHLDRLEALYAAVLAERSRKKQPVAR